MEATSTPTKQAVVRVPNTEWTVTNISSVPQQQPSRVRTGTITVTTPEGDRTHFNWKAVYGGENRWEIEGDGARLRSGGCVPNIKEYPFTLDRGVNIGLKEIIVRWLNDQPRAQKANSGNGAAVPKPIPPLPPPLNPAPQPLLMSESRVETAPSYELVVIALPLQSVVPWPMNPRKMFKQAALRALESSMAGPNQVQPILVRPFVRETPERYLTRSENGSSHYQVVDGERRWRSLMAIHATTVRAIIVYPNDAVEHHRMSVIANMHREAHSHYEYATAVVFQAEAGRNVKEMADDFSKSETWIRNYLSLRGLVPEIFELLNPDVGDSRELPFNQALLLAQIVREKQAEALKKAREEGGPCGPKGVLARLKELASGNEYRSSTAPGSGGKRRKPAKTAKLVSRAIAAVQFNAASLLRLREEFEKSVGMKSRENREAVAAQVKEVAETLLVFSRELVSDIDSS